MQCSALGDGTLWVDVQHITGDVDMINDMNALAIIKIEEHANGETTTSMVAPPNLHAIPWEGPTGRPPQHGTFNVLGCSVAGVDGVYEALPALHNGRPVYANDASPGVLLSWSAPAVGTGPPSRRKLCCGACALQHRLAFQ